MSIRIIGDGSGHQQDENTRCVWAFVLESGFRGTDYIARRGARSRSWQRETTFSIALRLQGRRLPTRWKTSSPRFEKAEWSVAHLVPSPLERRLRTELDVYRRTAKGWRTGAPTAAQILALRQSVAEIFREAQEELPTVRLLQCRDFKGTTGRARAGRPCGQELSRPRPSSPARLG
jgi:hypothetical protein